MNEIKAPCDGKAIRIMAQPGDIVTLSPACSSFDLFKNFEERGNTFCAIVESLH